MKARFGPARSAASRKGGAREIGAASVRCQALGATERTLHAVGGMLSTSSLRLVE